MAMRVAASCRQLMKNRPVSTASFGVMVGLGAYGGYTEFINERNAFVTTESPASTLPRKYNLEEIRSYWSGRPITVTLRILDILSEAVPIASRYVWDFRTIGVSDGDPDRTQREHASRLRQSLTRLGPAFVKAGQQLSIRPDLVPPTVLKELQLLCDAVDPMEDEAAMEILCEELGFESGEDLERVFLGLKLVASASLGQVYKAELKDSKEQVAIKVQRPDMVKRVSLDLFLLHQIAKLMDGFTTAFTEQPPFNVKLLDTFARGSYMELDYENEARNQIRFKTELGKRKSKVFIPKVHSQYTSRRVLTSEWVDGIKLSDAPPPILRSLIPIGVELFLTQLLDIGAFHADPHPGNLFVRKDDGALCLLDFGLCTDIDETSRHAMTTAIVHLLTGDFNALVQDDAKKLGFLPQDLDTTELTPILTKILTEGLLESGSNLHARRRKLMQISNELNEVFFRYPFTVPPFFALVTRGLGLLEGIALTGDPDFDIFQASYPYARKRAIEIFGIHGLNQMRSKIASKT